MQTLKIPMARNSDKSDIIFNIYIKKEEAMRKGSRNGRKARES